MEDLIDLSHGLAQIKEMIEEAIREKGESGVRSVITSSKTINVLHEVVKSDVIRAGVNHKLIRPALGASSPETRLAGFLKFKTQGVCVFPNHIQEAPEEIAVNGLHTGKTDRYGQQLTEHILAINLRSQLSSLGKNRDTLYERTYAESVNLHRRAPKMVLGEVYLISVRELDASAVKQKRVVYKPPSPSIAKGLKGYIQGFAALNNRATEKDDLFKYERIALLIVDFSQTPVKVYESVEELGMHGYLQLNVNCSLEQLTYTDFAKDLLGTYERRFGTGRLS